MKLVEKKKGQFHTVDPKDVNVDGMTLAELKKTIAALQQAFTENMKVLENATVIPDGTKVIMDVDGQLVRGKVNAVLKDKGQNLALYESKNGKIQKSKKKVGLL